MNRYEVPSAVGYSTKAPGGQVIVRALPRTLAGGLHEALIGAEVIGYVEVLFEDASIRPAIVVRRQRPFIPCGTDPKLVNKECSRMFAILPHDQVGAWAEGERFDVVEVTPP